MAKARKSAHRKSTAKAAAAQVATKVAKTMSEAKAGTLKSSSGKKVTSSKQALAIALSQAGVSKPKKKAGRRKKS